MATKIIGSDTAKVYETATGRSVHVSLYWGDEVDVVGTSSGRPKIKFRQRKNGQLVTVDAFLGKDVVFTDEKPLKVRFVDVGQGDGAIVETPSGKLILIDGGEEEQLHRYIGAAFVARPVPLDTIVVTHGDADHFSGLTKLLTDQFAPKVTVERVFHNGLAKRPSKKAGKKRPDEEMFGATAERQGELYCTELVDDLRTVPDAQLNEPFVDWKNALLAVKKANGQKPAMKRLAAGADFKLYENEGLKIDVLGPIEETVSGKPALKMLHESPQSSSYSASHTVNGHSIVLHMTYGNVRFFFAADLNEESEELLLATNAKLQSEVLKVPHHGSADFNQPLLEAVAPIVSIVSSGDESAAKDYIHPRAVLVGALGHASRSGTPLILVTEMVAFFSNLSEADRQKAKVAGIDQWFRLVRREQFGIVHVRTDGKRLLVVTRGAKSDGLEAYAYKVDASHNVKPAVVSKA